MRQPNTSKAEAGKTVLVIVVGCLLLYWYRRHEAFLIVATVVGLLGVASGYLARKIHGLWMGLAKVLGLVMPNILLSLVFFLLLTPLAFLYRLFRKEDPLMLDNDRDSTFRETGKTFSKEFFERPW